MKNINSLRIIFGIGFVLLAISLFADQLFDVSISFGRIIIPSLILLFGVLELLKSRYIAGVFGLVLGSLLLAQNYIKSIDNIWVFAGGFALLFIGYRVLVGGTKRSYNERNLAKDIYFSGSEEKIISDNFEGGYVNTFCGGVELDLTRAVIQKEATLHVSAIMGGIEMSVPDNWNIKTKVQVLMGGIADERKKTIATEKDPTLIIEGDVIMGGVNIK